MGSTAQHSVGSRDLLIPVDSSGRRPRGDHRVASLRWREAPDTRKDKEEYNQVAGSYPRSSVRRRRESPSLPAKTQVRRYALRGVYGPIVALAPTGQRAVVVENDLVLSSRSGRRRFPS